MHQRLSPEGVAAGAEAGADAVVVACPLCHQNLDPGQSQVNATCSFPTSTCRACLTPGVGLRGAFEEELLFHKHAVDRPLVASKLQVADAVKLQADEAARRRNGGAGAGGFGTRAKARPGPSGGQLRLPRGESEEASEAEE